MSMCEIWNLKHAHNIVKTFCKNDKSSITIILIHPVEPRTNTYLYHKVTLAYSLTPSVGRTEKATWEESPGATQVWYCTHARPKIRVKGYFFHEQARTRVTCLGVQNRSFS